MNQTFDQWYQTEGIKLGKPSKKLYDLCLSTWRQIEKRGERPDTAKIIHVLIIEPFQQAVTEMVSTFDHLAISSEQAAKAIRKFDEIAKSKNLQ